MILNIEGQVNVYYVQTLCMIFYPGEKFSEDQEITPETPMLNLKVQENDEGYIVNATLTQGEKCADAQKNYAWRNDIDKDRLLKLALGDAILAVCGEVCGYRPSWGMLTGVRPSKVATDLLQKGVSKTRVKKILSGEYFVIPKKAALATDVALNEARLIAIPDKKDCSVYISIPFCPTRCAYCSFVSYTSKRLLSLIPEYLAKLCDEIKDVFACINKLGLHVKTVYIGGGTPTILDAEQLRMLLSVIAESTDVTKLEEYTLESGRPDTITAEKFAVAKAYGVTRVSVNPQILCDEVLQGIGRAHNSDEFYRAFEIARRSFGYTTPITTRLPVKNFTPSTLSMYCCRIVAEITIHAVRVGRITHDNRTVGRSSLTYNEVCTSHCASDSSKDCSYGHYKSLFHFVDVLLIVVLDEFYKSQLRISFLSFPLISVTTTSTLCLPGLIPSALRSHVSWAVLLLYLKSTHRPSMVPR